MKKLKLIAGLFLLFGIGSTAVYAQDNGIVDFVESRDLVAVKSMFSNNWQWLGMDDAQDTEFIDNLTGYEEGNFKVLRINGMTVGCIAYWYDEAPSQYSSIDDVEGRIWYLVVDNSFHHKGCGEQLMNFAINDMRAHGVTEVTLCTRKDNVVARKLYEQKFGFEEEEEKYVELILHLA